MDTPNLDEQGRHQVRVHLSAAIASLKLAEHMAKDEFALREAITDRLADVEDLRGLIRE